MQASLKLEVEKHRKMFIHMKVVKEGYCADERQIYHLLFVVIEYVFYPDQLDLGCCLVTISLLLLLFHPAEEV